MNTGNLTLCYTRPKRGFFVESPKAEDIAAALESFLRTEIKFERVSCRKFAQRFSWKRVVEQAPFFYAK